MEEAIASLKNVLFSGGTARLISSICVEAAVLGHRAAVVIHHASRGLAAYRRHATPSRDDIYDVAALALAHRARQPLPRHQHATSPPHHGGAHVPPNPSPSHPPNRPA